MISFTGSQHCIYRPIQYLKICFSCETDVVLTLRQHLAVKILYSDTDSLLYEIKHTDFYQELAFNKRFADHFDLSNYPKEHRLYNEDNKMVTLKFKDELAGVPIQEFIGLKPKMYSIMAGGIQKLSAKGVTRYAQRKMPHDVYKSVLESGQAVKTYNTRIGSKKHQLQTIRTNKVSLSGFDDKRFVLENGVDTLPHGHYLNRDIEVMNDIIDDPEWGSDEMPASPTWDEMTGNDPIQSVSQTFPEERQNTVEIITPPPYVYYPQEEEPMSLTQQLMEEWSPPDPGYHQRTYSDSELEDGVANLDASFEEQSPERNPLIIDKAIEADVEEARVEVDGEQSSDSDCVIVAQLTEDEANAIEDLEHLIDFDNWFSDDEFVNRLKRAKRRRLQIQDDSESE